MLMKFECHLNFGLAGNLLKSNIMDFTVYQQYVEGPDAYYAVRKNDPETVFAESTLGDMFSRIVDFTLERL